MQDQKKDPSGIHRGIFSAVVFLEVDELCWSEGHSPAMNLWWETVT